MRYYIDDEDDDQRPAFHGGQGRSDEDIESDGQGALCWAVAAVVVAAILFCGFMLGRL